MNQLTVDDLPKLAEKDALAPPAPKKQFVSGEGFLYLGRSYRLLVVDEQDVPVKLERGPLEMLRSSADEGGAHMFRWNSERGQPWLEKRVASFQRRVGVEPTGVTVQDLGYRGGSPDRGRPRGPSTPKPRRSARSCICASLSGCGIRHAST